MNSALHLSEHNFVTDNSASFSFSVNKKMLRFSEEQLVEGLKQRKQHIFSYLYDNYAATLNGVISRSVQNKESAEDLLQEVFVKIWNSIDSYDITKGRLYTWMITLTVNHTLDFTRSKNFRVRKQIEMGDIADKQLTDPTYKPEKFDNISIKKNIERLKPAYILLINMAYYYGFTQKEIAKNLGMPLGTVKTKLRTAITELRKTVV